MNKRQKIITSPAWHDCYDAIVTALESFDTQGETLHDQRNVVKRAQLNGQDVVIKSFRVPAAIQSVIYASFRKSKARRSFENASRLLSLGVSTPEPIAWVEEKSGARLGRSYYICRYQPHAQSMADILKPYDASDASQRTLVAFTEFTFQLHQKNILHIDHNSGNTLISKDGDAHSFSLIDINRMRFMPLNLRQRMNNFVRLSDDAEVLQIIAHSYARVAGYQPTITATLLFALKKQHLRRIEKKRCMKHCLKRR